MPNDSPQQANMFTGDWEARRTRTPKPQQTAMFTLRETFEFGAKAHPRFAYGGTPALQLTNEDVRTPEEIERDLIREAEKLTQPMFAPKALANTQPQPEPLEIEDEEEHESALAPADTEKVSKFACYCDLVTIAYEKTATLWVDKAYRRRFNAQLPHAMLSAQSAGLTAAEIDAAIQIGEYKGRKEQASMPILYDIEPETDDVLAAAVTSPMTTGNTPRHEGFRAKLRREHVHVRIRHPQSISQEVVLELHMESDSIQSQRDR